jgi:hypothetical protein
VENAFRNNELKELLLLKGTRLISVNRQQVEQKDFEKIFKHKWEQNK